MLLLGYNKRQRHHPAINTIFLALSPKLFLRHNFLDLMVAFSILLEPSIRPFTEVSCLIT